MKKLLLLGPIWFVSVTALTIMCVFWIQSRLTSAATALAHPAPTKSAVIASVEKKRGEVKGLQSDTEGEDARAIIIARFLERHTSPMRPYDEYAQKIVAIADRHNLDYRLLPAIAMQESNLCKKIPPGSYNCLGFGVHERGTLGFENYEAGFERAAETLAQKYVGIGLTTPEKIMRKYTPSSTGSWANSVNQWIAEMEYDSRELGRDLKTDADLLEYIDLPEENPLTAQNL